MQQSLHRTELGIAGGGRPALSKAPLIEAVFELRGKMEQSFSLIPGRIAGALAKDYPDAVETELAPFAAMIDQASPALSGLAISHQFKASDGKRLVQLGPGGVSFNTLAYQGFASFRASISDLLTIYFDLAVVQSVERIGLRYLNRVIGDKGRLLSGFTVRLDWPDLPGGTPTAFAGRMLLHYTEPPGQLGAALAQSDSGPTLDLDFFIQPDRAMTLDEVLAWADKAHDRIYEAFTGLVSPDLFESWR